MLDCLQCVEVVACRELLSCPVRSAFAFVQSCFYEAISDSTSSCRRHAYCQAFHCRLYSISDHVSSFGVESVAVVAAVAVVVGLFSVVDC